MPAAAALKAGTTYDVTYQGSDRVLTVVATCTVASRNGLVILQTADGTIGIDPTTITASSSSATPITAVR